MASTTEICNRALARIGVNTIANIDENTELARKCKLFFESSRLELLRMHQWSFAQKRRTLSLITVPDAYQKYEYAYLYPSDCLKINGVRVEGYGDELDYETVVFGDDNTKVIQTDGYLAVIFYTANVNDTDKFDDLFSMALEYKLGMDMATVLTKDENVLNTMMRGFSTAMDTARTVDNRENNPEDEIGDSYVRSRYFAPLNYSCYRRRTN